MAASDKISTGRSVEHAPFSQRCPADGFVKACRYGI